MLAVLSFATATNAQDIPFTSNELYPEGIAYSKKQDAFFVSSLHYGKIGKVTRKGVYRSEEHTSELQSRP